MNEDHKKIYGWAIVGTGLMGRLFPPDLQTRSNAKIVSIISRNKDSAIKLAKLHGLDESVCFDNYETGINRKEVDVVYLATPPSEHAREIEIAAKFHKAILCEKPFTSNASESREAIKVAREEGVLLVEALFSHWTPLWIALRTLFEGKNPDFPLSVLGKPLSLQCAIGIPQSEEGAPSLFNPTLAGGALGAVGVYPINLAYTVFGVRPSSVEGKIVEGPTKVDDINDVVFHYKDGGKAEWKGFIRQKENSPALIRTEHGEVEIGSPWWYPSKIFVRVNGTEKTIQVPAEGKGYGFEVDEVHECLKNGKTESTIFPLERSQEIMELMDEMRRKLTKPFI